MRSSASWPGKTFTSRRPRSLLRLLSAAMRRRAKHSILAILACVAPLATWPASSTGSSTFDFLPCAHAAAFACSTLSVPLDRAGNVPGTISLSVERRLAGAGPAPSAVVALAGGPGQAAIPLDEFIAEGIAPSLASRDLLVFD